MERVIFHTFEAIDKKYDCCGTIAACLPFALPNLVSQFSLYMPYLP
ncbi:MAG: hypothetical protein AAF915_09410 [Cyanobacteria bacterium P01_D01_bin.50]